MHIVLTNDDGYDAPGLRTLWQVLNQFENVTVDVIAPHEPYSGRGHVVTHEFDCRVEDVEPFGRTTIVEATPADCVRVAAFLPDQRRPDWVIAGINRGGNLGIDLHYSGTVAAAREAAVLGIPAISISQIVKSALPDDWQRTAKMALPVLAAILQPEINHTDSVDPQMLSRARQTISPCLESMANNSTANRSATTVPLWNINLPRLQPGEDVKEIRLAPPSTCPLAIDYDITSSDQKRLHFSYKGRYHDRPVAPGTDVEAAFNGTISISALHLPDLP